MRSGELLWGRSSRPGPQVHFTPDESHVVCPANSPVPRVIYRELGSGEVDPEIANPGPTMPLGGRVAMARLTPGRAQIVYIPWMRTIERLPRPTHIPDGQDVNDLVQFSQTGRIVSVRHERPDSAAPAKIHFYRTESGVPVGSLANGERFSFASGDAFMFLSHDDGSIGMYRSDDVLPGAAMTTWGRVKRNELLPNYPNPFNPETWIPYRLAEATDVTVRIYGPTGRVVRTLDLARQPAGDHVSTQDAAHWDGRNEIGEQVASGVYFVRLDAGSFNDTRRMALVK